MKNILTKFEDNVQTMMASMNTMMENITKSVICIARFMSAGC